MKKGLFKGLNRSEQKEIDRILSGIKENERVQNMKKFVQHGKVSTYRHCENVTRLSYLLNKRLGLRADTETLLKGAMLHDFYLYDWHEKDNGTHDWHGFIHADRAIKNAETVFGVNDKVKHVVHCHMWPLNITRLPRSREAWIVCVADKCVSLFESLFLR
ncbi:MAG: HD domain-containing protein [Lachnospiraceae bacterium]|nr:HD domain-containing protein [Lachnospiraceae bacterium]